MADGDDHILARYLPLDGDEAMARYYGPRQPDADTTSVDTSHILSRIPKPNPVVDFLRAARDRIPENREHAVSMLNMIRGGLDTASNWLDYRNKPTPSDYKPSDVLAPLGAATMTSMGLNALGAIPKNSVGIFGGRLAATADKAALAKAEEMAAAGADRREIWDATGWFQGKDGKWRFEIDDSKMGFQVKPVDWIAKREDGRPMMAPNLDTAANKAAADLAPTAPLRLKRIFTHDDLQKAYPHGFSGSPDWQHQGIMSMPLRVIEGEGPAGMYARDFIGLHGSLPPGTAKGAAVHEIQHAIQDKEGFARGDSPSRHSIQSLKDEKIRPLDERINEVMASSPEAAELYRARNRLQAQLRGKEWTEADRVAMDQLEERLMNHPVGRQLDRLDWERQSLWHQSEDYWKNVARDRYMRAAGEVEARNAQERMRMTPEERRAKPPWETEDVPSADQILRMYNDGPQMSIDPKAIGMPADKFADYLEKKFGAEVYFTPQRDDLKLHHLVVPKDQRRKGIGSEIMREINEYADAHGKRVILSPAVADDHIGTTSRRRLVDFYKGHDYVENKGRKKDFTITEGMYRRPEKKE